MIKKIIFALLTSLVFNSCSIVTGLFGKKSIGDPNDPDFLNRVQELKSAYREGNIQALDELIEIYEDEDGSFYYIDPDTGEEVPCDEEGNAL